MAVSSAGAAFIFTRYRSTPTCGAERRAIVKKIRLSAVLQGMSEFEWASFHDSMFCALHNEKLAPGLDELTPAVLTLALQALPDHIGGAAMRWGFGDTVVGSRVVEFFQGEIQKHGSLRGLVKAAEFDAQRAA